MFFGFFIPVYLNLDAINKESVIFTLGFFRISQKQ